MVGTDYFFIDSRTIDTSVALTVARELRIPSAQRSVFLDADPARAAVRRQLARAAAIARRVGRAIAIGHPHDVTIQVLTERLPKLAADGILLVHVSELGWSRVENPEEVLKKGDAITVKIIGIEEGKKKGQLKIALSIKQTSGDPWETEAPKFKAGDKVPGKVTRPMGLGAFVQIAPGIEGLVHISEMSYIRRVNRPDEVVSPGETVSVMIKDVNLEGRRISLSIRDAEGDPWADIDEKYTPGQRIDGTVEKKEKFGYFINIAPGVTGLMPRSKISQSGQAGELDRLKVGDTVGVVIEEVHADTRRMTLGPVGGEETGDWKSYSKPQPAALGSLGEKLKEAMKTRNK